MGNSHWTETSIKGNRVGRKVGRRNIDGCGMKLRWKGCLSEMQEQLAKVTYLLAVELFLQTDVF